MPSKPLDVLPQRRLVLELKLAIDQARHSDERSMRYEHAVGILTNLLLENPTASLRRHVLHNLGCTRRSFVRRLSEKLPRSAATDLMWRMGCGTT